MAINLKDILQHFRPDDYKVYHDGKKIKKEEEDHNKPGHVHVNPTTNITNDKEKAQLQEN